MDFHLQKVKTKKSIWSSDKQLFRVLKQFIPIFVLSAVLPLFVFFVLNPSNLQFISRAEDDLELRLWFEPTKVAVAKNKSIELDLIASFTSETKVLPGIKLNLKSDGLLLDKNSFSYMLPFNGQVVLGKVKLSSSTPGTYSLMIDESSLTLIGFTEPLTTLTSPATILIKQ